MDIFSMIRMDVFSMIITALVIAIFSIAFFPLILIDMSMVVILFATTGWFFAILAFIFSGVPLGIALLILWIIIIGAS